MGSPVPVLLHGKHLCGEAADLSLRAASRLAKGEEAPFTLATQRRETQPS